jgi:hypothetical protein
MKKKTKKAISKRIALAVAVGLVVYGMTTKQFPSIMPDRIRDGKHNIIC